MIEVEQYFGKLELKTEPMIDDTTLRDGIQMPGLAISAVNAARIVELLFQLGVDRVELFHYQKEDREAIKLIHKYDKEARIAGWCRALKSDIDSALDCDLKEVGISHPVSKIHFQAKWPDKTEEDILNGISEVVEYAAKDQGLRVFVHGEDSTRADWDFEKKYINIIADSGAECYRICDTVGIGLSDVKASIPNGIPAKIKAIKQHTKIKDIEIHTHDDFGNAVENTLAAIRASSGIWNRVYASTTFLGMGERAGNAETEKVMMNLYFHHGIEKYKDKINKLKEIADYIAKSAGLTIPPNKAIVGDYAFAHESGIHTHGVLNNPLTYEPYPPEFVGNWRRLTIGKQSGKTIMKHKIFELTGEKPDSELLKLVFKKVKATYRKGRKASLKEEEFKKIYEEISQNTL